jgi:hypothetical protein
MEHDISKLQASLRAFDNKVAELSQQRVAELLIPVIHRPGWTTIAEFALVAASLEAMQHQVDGLAHMARRLVEAAGQVGTER